MKKFLDRVRHDEGGCWMWTASKNAGGYGLFNYAGRTMGAHRASYMMHCGEIPKGLCVLHQCDTPACVNPDHLFLGTIADNNRDMLNKGRQVRGENQGAAKLTDEGVMYIRTSKEPCAQIAKRWGLRADHVREVRRGLWWTHVPPDSDEALYPTKKPVDWVYTEGADRNTPHEARSHIYCGPHSCELVGPLCGYGWNRSDGEGFSILRGTASQRGSCATCRCRRQEGRGPVAPWPHRTKWA